MNPIDTLTTAATADISSMYADVITAMVAIIGVLLILLGLRFLKSVLLGEGASKNNISENKPTSGAFTRLKD